jgi:V8-like Glu-specific endopeptidase
MKRYVSVILFFTLCYQVFSQKVPVHVTGADNSAVYEWKILDDSYKVVFEGSDYFPGDSITFALDANAGYIFLVSVNKITQDSSALVLYLDYEPLFLIKPGIGEGDHMFPFYTGVRLPETKITGGTDASITEFPWQVYISSGNLRCGGSIIGANWVLTAAHCVLDASGTPISPTRVFVKVGANNPFITSEGETYSADRVIPHENYNDQTLENDIALIRLANIINNPVARPIAIVTPADVAAGALKPGVMTWVTGWGLTSVNPKVYPTRLQKLQLPIITRAQASTVWSNIASTDIMAGYLNGNKDACSGDSGGPLVVPIYSEYRLAGIVSWGSSECDTYGAYTNVSLFRSWISSNSGINPLFLAPPVSGDTLICSGETASSYSVNPVSGAASYEWRLSPVTAGSVSGSQTSSIVTWNRSYKGSATLLYRITVAGETSDWSRLGLRVVENTSILSLSADTTICAMKPVTISTRARGYNLVYNWYKDENLVSSGADSVLRITSATTSNTGNYRVQVTGRCGSALSPVTRLTVYPVTEINNLTPDTNIAAGDNVSLNVGAVGQDLTYQWLMNGNTLPGSNAPDLELNNVRASDIGNYNVIVSGACGTVTSDSIYVYVSGNETPGSPEVMAWPTLTHDFLNVAIYNDATYNIAIYNNMGQLVRRYTNLRYQNNVDVSYLSPGTYILNVYNSAFRKSVKIIKN